MLTSRIEGAQKKVEEFHFVNRKNVVKYDDVLNEQREQVYATRREILEGEDLHEMVAGWFEDVVEAAVDAHTGDGGFAERLGLGEHVGLAPVDLPDPRSASRRSIASTSPARSCSTASSTTRSRPTRRGSRSWGEELTRNLERWVRAAGDRRALARAPRQHGLHARGHRPARLRPEGPAGRVPRRGRTSMFDEMDFLVKQETVRALIHVEVAGRGRGPVRPYAAEHPGLLLRARRRRDASRRWPRPAPPRTARSRSGEACPGRRAARARPTSDEVGRNDPCSCGSGKKYKKCHGA